MRGGGRNLNCLKSVSDDLAAEQHREAKGRLSLRCQKLAGDRNSLWDDIAFAIINISHLALAFSVFARSSKELAQPMFLFFVPFRLH